MASFVSHHGNELISPLQKDTKTLDISFIDFGSPQILFRFFLISLIFDPALIAWYWFSSPKVGLLISPHRPFGKSSQFSVRVR